MQFDCREDIIQLTPLWTGDRFDDGRPRVPDDILRRIWNDDRVSPQVAGLLCREFLGTGIITSLPTCCAIGCSRRGQGSCPNYIIGPASGTKMPT